MQNMRFFKNEEYFLKYSWVVYQPYFTDRESFIDKYNHIDSPEKKNSFLRLSSSFYFLVIAGNYSSIESDIPDLSFVDQTYKFIAIIALIESIYDENKYIDFYQWIMRSKQKIFGNLRKINYMWWKKRQFLIKTPLEMGVTALTPKEPKKSGVFPINTPSKLTNLYEAYKKEHGNTSNVVKFFKSLDDPIKSFIRQSIVVLEDSEKISELEEVDEAIEVLSKFLYQIRSDYMHGAKWVLEFDSCLVFSVRKGKNIECSMELKDLRKIFESGLLQHFNITPDKNQILTPNIGFSI